MQPITASKIQIHFIHSSIIIMKKPFAIYSKVPSYYASGIRRLSVLHARIRNNCSNLNLDLFNNFLRPDPTCSCQVEPENAEHYFLRCHKRGTDKSPLGQKPTRTKAHWTISHWTKAHCLIWQGGQKPTSLEK